MALTKVSRGLLTTSIVDNGNATAITIDASENVGIGASPATQLFVKSAANAANVFAIESADAAQRLQFGVNTSNGGSYIFEQKAQALRFGTSDTERMQIDASGNLLVGKTTTGDYVAGIEMQPAGAILSYRTGSVASIFGRTDTGEITRFTRGTSIIGRIGTTTSAGGTRFAIGGTGDPGIIFAGTGVFPATEITASDNVSDLGSGTYRWKNVYRAGSTYSTSDRNMKQDIRELTGAERNVAVAAKGLLKAFRFIDAVDRDGDSANIHFGIIAQELAEAFAAEGLDANDYQVYKTTVETDEYGNEQTRLNVCYENLLAFIISAI
jgi:hypothetical protein